MNFTNVELVVVGMVFAGIESGELGNQSSMPLNGFEPEFTSLIGGENCFMLFLDVFLLSGILIR